MTWEDARDQCKSLSDFEATVDLASIHSEQEQQFAKGINNYTLFMTLIIEISYKKLDLSLESTFWLFSSKETYPQ